jgi:hypothetical protein
MHAHYLPNAPDSPLTACHEPVHKPEPELIPLPDSPIPRGDACTLHGSDH